MKYILAILALTFTAQAQAVAFSCTAEINELIKVEIDSDSHPMNEDGSLYEVHTYIDSVTMGGGEVLSSAIEQHKEVKAGESDLLVFENNMSLKSIEDSESCDARKEFVLVPELAPMALCCMVQ
jgi:hypothetical protein